MIKISFKIDVSFCKLMVGVIGLSATVCAVDYFSKKKNKQPDKNTSVTQNSEVSRGLSKDNLKLPTSRLASNSEKGFSSKKPLFRNIYTSSCRRNSVNCLPPCNDDLGSRIEQNIRNILPSKSVKNDNDVSNVNQSEKNTNKENVHDVTSESHLCSVPNDSNIDENNRNLLRASNLEKQSVHSVLDEKSYESYRCSRRTKNKI